jgi:hypothetical protein
MVINYLNRIILRVFHTISRRMPIVQKQWEIDDSLINNGLCTVNPLSDS